MNFSRRQSFSAVILRASCSSGRLFLPIDCNKKVKTPSIETVFYTEIPLPDVFCLDRLKGTLTGYGFYA